MKRLFVVKSVLAMFVIATGVQGQDTWYVDDDTCPGVGSGTLADPFCSIQDGIDAASDTDTVLVSPGTYNELINFVGKAITLQSADGPDVTTIDGTALNNSVVKCVSGEGPNTVLVGFTITGGRATYGGGMYNKDSSPMVTNCTFSGNSATGGFLPFQSGGGMYNYHSSPMVTICTFSGNTADFGGGMFNWISSPTVTNCTFNGNSARSFGGGMSNVYSSPTVTDCTLSQNTGIYGGGMFNYHGHPTVTSCTFGENTASYGGGTYNHNSSPTVTNCTFTGNTAESDGGGMLNEVSSPTLTNCTFSGNSAESGSGGGMYNRNLSSPTLNNCSFTGNTTNYAGGGMSNVDGSSSTVTDCTFSGNFAGERGGGMFNVISSPTVTDCIFTDNSAGEDGGGMSSWAGTPTLTNCTFSGNTALWGAGMFNATSSPTVTNCTFTDNSADVDGGGMSSWVNSTPTLTNCTFSGNTADYGGGMSNWFGSSPTLTNCTFVANSAPNGRAVACDSYNQGDPSTVVMTNCILWDGGNEIWNNDGSTISINYSDVQGSWPGVGNIDADPLFVDSIGPDGIAGTEVDDLRLSPGSPCIDAGDNDAVPPDSLDLDDDGDIEEPIPFDLGGFARFFDDPDTPDTGNSGELGPPVVDMGAYEYQPPMVVPLDIMPQRCPNRLPRKAQGMIRIALVGTEAFDVSGVDLDSLLLKRADGLGGSIAPVRTPPGLAPEVRDVATPFEGELCECHRHGRDGVDDLLVVFPGGEFARALQLESAPGDTGVVVTLSGLLNDGTSFEGSDCVRIHPGSPHSKLPSPRRGETSR